MSVANSRWVGPALVAPCISFLFGVLAIPEIYAVYVSFFDENRFVGLKHYVALARQSDTVTATGNTLLFALGSVTLSLAIGLAIALLLNRESWAQRSFRTLAIAPFVIPPIVGAFAWKMMLDPNYGIINYYLTYVGVPMGRFEWLSSPALALFTTVLCYVWTTTPFVTLILLAALQNLPKSPFEAAAIDGAGRMMIFTRVLLPMLSPAITIAALFQIIFALREFAIPWVLTQGGPLNATYVLSMDVYRTLFMYGRDGLSAAIGVLILVLTFLLSVPLLRQALR